MSAAERVMGERARAATIAAERTEYMGMVTDLQAQRLSWEQILVDVRSMMIDQAERGELNEHELALLAKVKAAVPEDDHAEG